MQLGDADVTLVDDHQMILGQIVEKRWRRLPRLTARQVTRVVLDPRAVADLLDHLQVEHGALMQPLRLQQLPIPFELRQPLLQLGLDGIDRLQQPVARRDVVRVRVDRHAVQLPDHRAAHRVDEREGVDLVAEHLDAHGDIVVGREDLDHVSAHPELAALEIERGPLVLNLDQLPEHGVPVDLLPRLEHEHHPVVRLGRTEAVDARHGGHDDHVAALEQ